MAMTKREKAALRSAEIKGALHWSPFVPKDLPSSEEDRAAYENGPVFGWSHDRVWLNTRFLNAHRTYSEISAHGTGWPVTRQERQGGSREQLSIAQFSTRLAALRGLRHELALAAAEALHRVDELIAEAEADGEPEVPLSGGSK